MITNRSHVALSSSFPPFGFHQQFQKPATSFCQPKHDMKKNVGRVELTEEIACGAMSEEEESESLLVQLVACFCRFFTKYTFRCCSTLHWSYLMLLVSLFDVIFIFASFFAEPCTLSPFFQVVSVGVCYVICGVMLWYVMMTIIMTMMVASFFRCDGRSFSLIPMGRHAKLWHSHFFMSLTPTEESNCCTLLHSFMVCALLLAAIVVTKFSSWFDLLSLIELAII